MEMNAAIEMRTSEYSRSWSEPEEGRMASLQVGF